MYKNGFGINNLLWLMCYKIELKLELLNSLTMCFAGGQSLPPK